MSGNDAVVERIPILLTIKQVPVGATVHACAPGSSDPISDDDGPIPPLRKLFGGIPITTKLYPVPSLQPGPGGSILTGGYTTAKPGVRFRPTELFSPEDAPRGTKFAVYLDGKRMKYRGSSGGSDWRGAVELYKSINGHLVSTGTSTPTAQAQYLCKIELPENAQLVAVSAVGQADPPYWHSDYLLKREAEARAEDERLLAGETFSPSNSPARTFFVAFLDGRRAAIKLYKGTDGALVSATDDGKFGWAYLRPVNFGDDVVLAPVSEIGKSHPPWGHSDCRKAWMA